ncbi:unnamed protein product [Gongylonema pulchrum]|uniref:Proteasome subunit alpha type-3 n=1 Tax=Gongylonema pulchrum TaxID=637853 RepID=A0A183EGW2_9BILA|nr:unnamed protein product [Gongylonema pulchrum]
MVVWKEENRDRFPRNGKALRSILSALSFFQMSSIGTGYDLAAATFSPDGRIFQVDNGGTMIAIRGKDGVVTAFDKLVTSKLYVENANPRMANAGEYIGMAMAGVYPDCRALLDYALAEYVHVYTLGISRPFGSSIFLTAWDEKVCILFLSLKYILTHLIDPAEFPHAQFKKSKKYL